jgi:hypothetical protein
MQSSDDEKSRRKMKQKRKKLEEKNEVGNEIIEEISSSERPEIYHIRWQSAANQP